MAPALHPAVTAIATAVQNQPASVTAVELMPLQQAQTVEQQKIVKNFLEAAIKNQHLQQQQQ